MQEFDKSNSIGENQDIEVTAANFFDLLSRCLVFLQLSAKEVEGKLNDAGLFALMTMRLDGWDANRTDDIIKKFIDYKLDSRLILKDKA